MRIQTDSLKYAKMLKAEGFPPESADGFISTLTEIEIHNVYSTVEVDAMLSESVKEIFARQDQKLAEQQREFDARMQDMERRDEAALGQLKNELKEGRDRSDRIWQGMMGEFASHRRWTIATIITVGLSLATYLSALLHFSH